MMHLLALTADGPGGRGGIARFCADWLAAIAGLPEIRRVTILPRRPGGAEWAPPPGIALRRSAGGRAGYLAAAAALGIGADAILCAHLNLLPAAWLARGAARALGRRVPVQLVVYGIEAWTPRRAVRLAGAPDQVVAISDLTARRFAAWSGHPAGRIGLLSPAIDEARFTPGPSDPALARRLGLGGGPVVLGLGRLHGSERYKGFDEMIGVLPDLVRRHPGLVYVVAGEGDDRPRLEALAAARGVSGHVVFTGFVGEADKVGLYRLADAFVLAGWGEGFGIALIEAMACGVPVVASRLDGSREAVAGGHLGELADPHDPADLVAAVERALARPRGRPEGLARFFLEAFRARTQALCRDLMADPIGKR